MLAEIIRGRHEAKVPAPDAIGHDTSSQRIVGGGEALREFQPATRIVATQLATS
ncbi:MAG: hypothetical protein ACI9UA_001947 [Pseudoalteromonas tetraodonis]|jgi:hypothetical protein